MFCYALSPNDGTEWRIRTQTEAEHFIDVSSLTSDVIARMINEDQIQILINLNGYTKVQIETQSRSILIRFYIFLFLLVLFVCAQSMHRAHMLDPLT